jgi:hypothetical protein
MGIRPHALYSRLYSDLSTQISPLALHNLKNKVFDWPEMSLKEQAAASLSNSLLKKWEGSMTNETKQKALQKFLLINHECDSWRLVADERYGDDMLLGELKQFIWEFWNLRRRDPLVDHPYQMLERGEVGPGSAVGSIGGDFYTKLFSSRTATTNRSLYYWYRRYIRGFPEWNNAELARIETHGDIEIVEGNRLDFVPKNDDISRSICVEPTLNMFYQLGFGNILSSRLRDYWGIDLKYQQFKNRELARRGSLDESFSTIDLSSASDSISLKMLEWLLPRDFFAWLKLLRCSSSRLPNKERLALNMVSTMGNGFTFPLQTIIFAGVVLSAMKLDGIAPIFPRGLHQGNFGVNGDDIVVPKSCTLKVLRLLHLLGFKCNKEKTFVEGPFRESCGGDFREGRNIRGVYIKTLNGPHDYYSVINQLNLFSTRTGILLPSLVQLLLSKVRYLPVPVWENDNSGVKVPFSIVKKSVRVDRNTQSILYYAWTSLPPPSIRIGDWYLKTPKGFKRREFNSSGLFLSVLQGSVNSTGIPLRPRATIYRAKPRIACNWDCPVTSSSPIFRLDEGDARMVQLFASWFHQGRFESAVYLNLFK